MSAFTHDIILWKRFGLFCLPIVGKMQEAALNCLISSLLLSLSPHLVIAWESHYFSFLRTSSVLLHRRLRQTFLLPCQSGGGKHLSCVNWPQWYCSITAGVRAISRSKPARPHNSNQTEMRPQGSTLTAQAGRPNNVASLRNRYVSRWGFKRHYTAEQTWV